MLQLVLGGSGSGKTTLLYQKMKERALLGQKSILLVPEQFTASTEARIYHALGDEYSGMVQSFSFTTLAEQVLTACGGAAVKTLSDAGRVVLVRRAMQELQDSLTYYKKQRPNAAFCEMVSQTINELKSAGIGAADLGQLAEGCGGGRDKLADLALLFATYETQVRDTGLDPADRVNLAAQQLAQACSAGELPDFLIDRAVFIDEFDTFNTPKKNLLGALFCAVESLWVALCDDGSSMPAADPHKPTFLEDVSLFSGSRRVGFDLRTLARKADAPVKTPIILTQDLRHATGSPLAALSSILAGHAVPDADDDAPSQDFTTPDQKSSNAQNQNASLQDQPSQNLPSQNTSHTAPTLSLFAAQSREEEVRAAVAEMQRLVRTDAATQYGGMAIVCRDPSVYRSIVRRECRLADVPLFCDETTTPTFSAPVTAVRALLSILCGFDYTDQMVALAKTGLCATPCTDENGKRILRTIPEHQILALENYVYTWSPKRGDWQKPFTRSENGFGIQPDATPEEGAKTPPAEAARRALLAPIDTLCAVIKQDKQRSAASLTKHLYECLQALGAEQEQARQVAAVRKVSGIPASEAAAREWNVVMELLNQMVDLLGDDAVSVAEYADLFLLLLNTTDLGHIPQNIDAVIFTSAGQMRLDAPKHIFLLGLAEGEFPAPPTAQGLLSDADRDALMAQQIELPDCFENKMIREEICFYKALTAASDTLWMSWPEGLGYPVSSALSPVLAQITPHIPAREELLEHPTTPAAAIDRLGGLWGDAEKATQAASVYVALQQVNTAQNGKLNAPLTAFARLDADAPRQLTQRAPLGELLGDTLEISASKVEKYHTCQYAYFLQYLLRLRPRQKAELTPNHSGSLMHWVLEQALTTAPTPYDAYKPVPFVDLTDTQLKALAEALCDAYHALYMPEESVRFGYLMLRLKKSMIALFYYLQKELKQSEFTPAACEARIGTDEFAAPTYTLEAGKTLKLIGVIDRIDTWTDTATGDTWLRVVDYKTGDKSFNLKEVYDGLDCQMLLYLFAALKYWNTGVDDRKAAGVQYLLADPAPQTQTRDAAETALTPSIEGMLADNEAVIKAADKDQTGEYLPFSMKNAAPDPRAKKTKLADAAKMKRIETHLDTLLLNMANGLYQGNIAAEPLCASKSKHPCKWCDYRTICGHEDGKHERTLTAPSEPFAPPPAITPSDVAPAEAEPTTETKEGV